MNVTDQLLQVRILFAQDGFVSVLEKVAAAMMSKIIPESIPCQEPPHDGGQRRSACPEQKVKVIWHQRPSVASCLAPDQDRSQTLKEIVPILIGEKDLLSSDSTPDHMMQSPWSIYSTLPRHENLLPH